MNDIDTVMAAIALLQANVALLSVSQADAQFNITRLEVSLRHTKSLDTNSIRMRIGVQEDRLAALRAQLVENYDTGHKLAKAIEKMRGLA